MNDYNNIYQPGKTVVHIDALSLLPLSEILKSDECMHFVYVLSEISIAFREYRLALCKLKISVIFMLTVHCLLLELQKFLVGFGLPHEINGPENVHKSQISTFAKVSSTV